jgi:hypothetical protein
MFQWSEEKGSCNFLPCLQYVQDQLDQINQQLSLHDRRLNLQIIDIWESWKNPSAPDKNLIVTNSWIKPELVDSTRYEQFAPSWYGIYAGPVDSISVTPKKKFNCFINRMDPIRQSWLYQLVRRDIFDQGFVSFNMDVHIHLAKGWYPPDTTPHDVFEDQFQKHLTIFQVEHELIKPQVPYRNFDSTASLDQVIMDSEFSIVLESYFSINEVITFSEKIFRCLKLPRPWILFSTKGSVQYLRNLGFDVLDDLVDHSYDNIDFEIDRQVALLDQAELMCKQTLTAEQISRCELAAQHNQQILDSMIDTFYTDVDLTFARAQKKCMEL